MSVQYAVSHDDEYRAAIETSTQGKVCPRCIEIHPYWHTYCDQCATVLLTEDDFNELQKEAQAEALKDGIREFLENDLIAQSGITRICNKHGEVPERLMVPVAKSLTGKKIHKCNIKGWSVPVAYCLDTTQDHFNRRGYHFEDEQEMIDYIENIAKYKRMLK